jgi:sigma-B regulation protein RsbU (phosphoserine phosphatase)
MELLIKLPDGRSFTHELGTLTEIIGRDRSCDIFVDDPSTSRRHARFTPTPEGYVIEDLGSKNGLLVNGEPRVSHLMQHLDTIAIGSVEVECRDPRKTEPATSVVMAEDDDLATSRATSYASRSPNLNLPQRRLEMIYNLSDRLVRLRSQDELLSEVLAIGFDTLHFERGAVGVLRSDRRVLEWPVVRNLYGSEGELTVSGTLVRRAIEHGERAIFTDQESFDPTMSIVQHGIRSAMCVPLMHGDEVLGVIYGDRTSTSATYTQEDIDFLAALARQASIGLFNCRLLEEQKQLARLNRDIDLARRIQTDLFPAELPERPELTVAAFNQPGNRVSGDYYDVLETREGRLWLLMADVMGEGVAAALVMANLQAAVRVTTEGRDDPGPLLARWNNLICRNTQTTRFITCLLAVYEPHGRELRIASAGHHLPLIYRGRETDPIPLDYEPGFPLGVVENAEFATWELGLKDDSFLYVAYTDGVIEAMNAQQELFGTARLLEAMNQARSSGPQSIVREVRRAVSKFVGGAPQSDDITLLAAQVGKAP